MTTGQVEWREIAPRCLCLHLLYHTFVHRMCSTLDIVTHSMPHHALMFAANKRVFSF